MKFAGKVVDLKSINLNRIKEIFVFFILDIAIDRVHIDQCNKT